MMLPRRTALKLVSMGAVTVFAGQVTFAQQSLRTRRSLTGMDLDDPDLSAYRDFVRLMKAKDQSQPVSWLGFANQHGSLAGGYKFCPHGDWYFLPWHRAYVLMYETAVQALTLKSDFAMPYWNWTEMRSLPDAFANPRYKGKPNPLFVRNRNRLSGANALTDSIVGQTQVIDKIYVETVFEAFGTTRNRSQTNLDPNWVVRGGGFQGILESTPHNLVHNNIGAYMPTAASPRDPIFFMHHSNIDRIWDHWNSLGRTNSTDPLWLNMPFTNNYLKPDGTPYTTIVKDLQNISALGYRYDFRSQSDNRPSDPGRESRLLAVLQSKPGTSIVGTQRFGGLNKTAATASNPLSQSMNLTESSMTALTAPSDGKVEEVYALIGDIALGDNVRGIRVFVNHPELSIETPDTDPHYVKTIAFLDHSRHGDDNANKQLPSVLVNLTATLKRLRGFDRLKVGEISVQLIPIPVDGVIIDNVGQVVPDTLEIVVL